MPIVEHDELQGVATPAAPSAEQTAPAVEEEEPLQAASEPESSEDTVEEVEEPQEHMIPKSRFDEINERMKAAEARANRLEAAVIERNRPEPKDQSVDAEQAAWDKYQESLDPSDLKAYEQAREGRLRDELRQEFQSLAPQPDLSIHARLMKQDYPQYGEFVEQAFAELQGQPVRFRTPEMLADRANALAGQALLTGKLKPQAAQPVRPNARKVASRPVGIDRAGVAVPSNAPNSSDEPVYSEDEVANFRKTFGHEPNKSLTAMRKAARSPRRQGESFRYSIEDYAAAGGDS